MLKMTQQPQYELSIQYIKSLKSPCFSKLNINATAVKLGCKKIGLCKEMLCHRKR